LTSRRGFARSGWSFFAVIVGASRALHAMSGVRDWKQARWPASAAFA
jgi:hypothetical protein